MGNSLEIDSVQLRFGDRIILNNIYVKAITGKITGILGRNGCGKTCLLKLIFGEIHTNEKSVRINGKVLLEDNRNPAEIRMLPQFNFLPKGLTVVQAFQFFNADFTTFCDLFTEFRDWSLYKIKQLSSGNIRILETFLILTSKTDFCILDEPFSHLSPKNATVFMEIMKQEKENKGIILTDHLYYYVTKVCDNLYVIKDCVTYPIDNLSKLSDYGYLNASKNYP